jgi:hypothetical protein
MYGCEEDRKIEGMIIHGYDNAYGRDYDDGSDK